MWQLSRSKAPRRLWNAWGWRGLLPLGLALMAGLMLFRLVFLVVYRGAFADASVGEVLLALLNGARFDLSVVLAFTGIPALLALLLSPLPFRKAVYGLLFAWVAVVGLGFAVLSAIDLNYYAFVARRVSFEVVEMRQDWRPIAMVILHGYPLQLALVLLGVAAIVLVSARRYARLLARPWGRVRWWSHLAQVALALPLLALAIRGGLQAKPLSVGMAFQGPHMAVGHLALNPIFTAVIAANKGRAPQLAYTGEAAAFGRTRALLGLPPQPEQDRYPLLRRQEVAPLAHPRNLVIITIESFSAQFTEAIGGMQDVTPNFNRLAREGLLFSNFYAAGTRSLEGIATILTGFPALPTETLIGSAAEQTVLRSVPLILREQGYSSFFLHGAFRGSMWFDTFAQRNGFDRYIAKEDFPNADKISDSMWGVFDEHTLERLHTEILAAPKPVLAYYFSLNPHTPFELPDPKYRRFGPEVPHAEMLNAVSYTDAALGRFFELARHSPYWSDTVFMVTADHNMGKWEMNYRERQWIPLLILVPGDPGFPRGVVDATLGSQVDMAPTALELLGISATQSFAGQSLLHPAAHRFALFNWFGQVGWIDDNVLMVHDLERPLALFDRRADPELRHNLVGPGMRPGQWQEVADLRAYFQTFNNLLLNNRMAPGEGGPVAARPLLPANAHGVR